jgi:Putative DNA-binding domain
MSRNVATFHADIAALLRANPQEPYEGPLRAAALYGELVFRQRVDALRNSYPTLKCAWESLGKDFRALVFDYCRCHPPISVDPNRAGERMSEYLGNRRLSDATLPAYLEEIADFEFLQYQVNLLDVDGGVGLERTLFVRHYGYPVLALTQSRATWKAPQAEPSIVIVCRNRKTQRRLEFVASTFDVMAIARRDGMDVGADPRIAEADALLVQAGVLP